MELVTFLITTYNSEEWINQCLNSVINQTYKNLQILIIDDGSTDQTVKLIKDIKDDRIELYCKTHSGISKSLNFSINKIKGKFVARLGADDYCDKERISEQIKFISEINSYGIVGANFILVDIDGKQINKIRNPKNHDDIIEQLPRRCCVWDGSVLMKTDLIHYLNGFDEKWIAGEDWDFYLRAIGLTKFYNIQEFLSYKRVNPSSISETNSAKQATQDILFNYNNSIIKNSKQKKQIAKSYFNLSYYFYYESDFEKASNYLNKAMKEGAVNFQFLRYFIFSKYLNSFVKFFRKYKLYRLLDWIRYFDKTNKFMRNKF